MNCPECKQPMLLGESGWVCAQGHGKIIPDPDTWKLPRDVHHRKGLQQRGDELAKGIKGLG